MKILQIAFNTMDIGGVQKDIIDYAESMPDYHFDVVVFSSEKGRLEKRFRELGGNVYRIIEYSGDNRLRKFLELFIKKFRIFYKTYQILKKHGPYNAIHSNNQFRSAITNSAAFFAGVKIRIVHSHIDRPPCKYGVAKKILLNAYRVILLIFSNVRLACSEGSAQYLYWNTKRSEIIFNGTDFNKFNIDKYGYKSNGFANFIHVGRYNPQKNQIFLLEIFSCILKQKPDSRLKLIGHGEDEKLIRERIMETDLKGSVEMLPPDSNVPELFAESEFMIFPSAFEGFPNVQIESQIMEVKCFVSDSITHESDLGLSTYISLDKSPNEWADIILEKIKDHNYSSRTKITEEQKNRVDVNVLAKRYIEIYNGKRNNIHQ